MHSILLLLVVISLNFCIVHCNLLQPPTTICDLDYWLSEFKDCHVTLLIFDPDQPTIAWLRVPVVLSTGDRSSYSKALVRIPSFRKTHFCVAIFIFFPEVVIDTWGTVREWDFVSLTSKCLHDDVLPSPLRTA
jgi:hypothetical protein